jgi:hypothetical protein
MRKPGRTGQVQIVYNTLDKNYYKDLTDAECWLP